MTHDPVPELDETSNIIIWPNDGKEMAFVAGGTFIMGANHGDSTYQPENKVKVAEFYIDRWPVTNHEYKKFVENLPKRTNE